MQFHDPAKSWGIRYYANQNVMGWQPALQVSEKLPGDWELVTRDLFKDYGTLTITGMALTPYDGAGGRFDHMLLGRTIEDLDKATAAALGKGKPAKPLAGKERERAPIGLLELDVQAGKQPVTLQRELCPSRIVPELRGANARELVAQ